jgi:hypothetical protein
MIKIRMRNWTIYLRPHGAMRPSQVTRSCRHCLIRSLKPNAATAVTAEPVSQGWWAGVRQAIADTFATRDIFADASALTGVIAAGVFGVWIGVNGGDIGGISLNPFEAQGFDIVDPFSGLDLSYLDGGA